MEELLIFLQSYGLPITLIALLGIALLGIMKYCNLFKKLDEQYRHYAYIGISVSISVIGTIIYLAVVKQFEVNYIITVSCAIYALNQAFYNLFKVCSVNELFVKLLDWDKQFLIKEKTNNDNSDEN